MADDIWDGIFAEMKGESSKETQKRKRQNSFASSFSDPMFRFFIEIWINLHQFLFQAAVVSERRREKRSRHECETSVGSRIHR